MMPRRNGRLTAAAIALTVIGGCVLDGSAGAGCAPDDDGWIAGGGGGGTGCYCGDGICGSCDTLSNCEIDCALCGDGHCSRFDIDCPEDCPGQIECGDGRCDDIYGETDCPEDCAPENCGDGYCDWDGEFGESESTFDCPLDCHCWNGRCEPELDENELTCWQDCSECGNGVCGPVEDHWICPDDCRRPIECGDLFCEFDETRETCPRDCRCGWDTCDLDETPETCPEDCAETCGDGECDESAGEDGLRCPADCRTCNDRDFPVDCNDGLGCWPAGTNCLSDVFYCGGGAYRCGWSDNLASCCVGAFDSCPAHRPHFCPDDGDCHTDAADCAVEPECDYELIPCSL